MARDQEHRPGVFNPRPDVEHACLYCGRLMPENMEIEPRPVTAAEYETWRHETYVLRRRRLRRAGEIAWIEGPNAEGEYRAQVYRASGKYGKWDDDFFCTDRCAVMFAQLAARHGVRYRKRTDTTTNGGEG
jgi:hypothetical protein